MSRGDRRNRGGGGGLSRRTALALIGGGGVLAVGASGAFDSLTGERPFQVGTAGDDEALLRLRTTEATPPAQEPFRDRQVQFDVTSGATVPLIRVENFVDDRIEFEAVDVTTNHGELSFAIEQPPSSVVFGGHAVLEAEVECTEDVTNVPFTIKIVATGEAGRVTVSREAYMTCSLHTPPEDPICQPFDVPLIRGGGDGITGRPSLGEEPPDDMTTETGTVSIVRSTVNNLEMDIEMDPDDGRMIEAYRVDVQSDPSGFPSGLGQYHLVEELDTPQTSVNGTIDIEDELGIRPDNPIYIAVHAELQTESAWAKGPFQGLSWRMYLDECGSD